MHCPNCSFPSSPQQTVPAPQVPPHGLRQRQPRDASCSQPICDLNKGVAALGVGLTDKGDALTPPTLRFGLAGLDRRALLAAEVSAVCVGVTLRRKTQPRARTARPGAVSSQLSAALAVLFDDAL